MQSFCVTAYSMAGPAAVYGLLLDETTWPKWMGVDSVEIVNRAPPAAVGGGENRLGEIRKVITGRHHNLERITGLVPNESYRYVILDGMLTGYQGHVALTTEKDGRTKIEWQANFRMSILGAAFLMKLFLKRWMQRAVDKLANLAASTPSDFNSPARASA